MNVTHFACGSVANESELKALEHLKNKMHSLDGEGEWIILTNLAFSVNHQLQSDEIDMVVIGPPGVRVIEVKHWSAQWFNANPNLVEQEADKLTNKARKIGTTLRKRFENLPHVDGVIFLTQDSSKLKQIKNEPIRGVQIYTLNDWKSVINGNSPKILEDPDIRFLGSILEPRSAVAIDGSLRRLGSYINLELQTAREERFHRIFKGIHSVRQDRVVMHLYDLSASDSKNVEEKARREFEALHHLQQYSWAPRILDSFQEAPGYAGEMFFFTITDPAAPSLQERMNDNSWSSLHRVFFARESIRALRQMHQRDIQGVLMIHRNLSPLTIHVKHDNTPIFTAFKWTKIPSDVSVASTFVLPKKWEQTVAPEIRSQGLGMATPYSDIYSLCASLCILFEGQEEENCRKALLCLKKGLEEAPEKRCELQGLENELSLMLGESVPLPKAPPARFWTEDQEIHFGNHTYRIVNHLGTGGVGRTFKVVQMDRSTKEDLGTYVAKVLFTKDNGDRILRSYNLVRPHLGRHAGLSTIFEVADEWSENNFVALMTWIEGTPLNEYIGVFPLLAEEFQEHTPEALAIRWIRSMCEALGLLHQNGLIHGDISPRNMIIAGHDIVLTDYDFINKIGEKRSAPGTVLYCSPWSQAQEPASPSDDIYALSASFFHVVFEKEPFSYPGVPSKEKGLNWEGINQEEYPILTAFLNRATNSDPAQRFSTVREALDRLSVSDAGTRTELEAEVKQEDSVSIELREERVEWLLSLLRSYPGSKWGNRETRGLDTDFAKQTYVKTNLEIALFEDIMARRIRLVILCGNAGDGKTALLQHLAERLGMGKHESSQRIVEGHLPDGLTVRMNLDGSASWNGRSADEILDEFLEPFKKGKPDEDLIHLLAINDGRLLEWIEKSEESLLTDELDGLLQEKECSSDSYIRFINLNQRSLVGSVSADKRTIDARFLESLIEHLYGEKNAAAIWKSCLTCSAKNRCEVFRAMKLFGPEELPEKAADALRRRARERLFEALQAVHLRGEVHITMRELRSSLIYILFGVHFCSDYHDAESIKTVPYWDRAFDPASPNRQGEVLRELVRLDPALEAHPHIDRRLYAEFVTDPEKTNGRQIDSARRRAYFEWTEERILEWDRDAKAFGLARGKHLFLFRNLPLNNEHMDSGKRKEIITNLCKGISRLEDLPPQALDRLNVPLRITPRTPTETAFWVEKPRDSFRLEPDLPKELKGGDRLHRQAFLIYRFQDGREERLRLGAELFHLLLELNEGYQLGDVSTEDTFAHLSIFIRRLIREDEYELLAWNPMQDESIYKISTQIEQDEGNPIQKLVLNQVMGGECS
ncbi:MAG: hypothetical protein C4527_21145 [Candidatus Omnitrophota bacterium]|jgi:serine/threonine protein kinase|nr:MAG: hypothetical protein C4527_21145 [Candidatus Omnitrophota bacterium]